MPATIATLAEGATVQLTIKNILPAVASYQGGTNKEKTFYCHDFLLSDEDDNHYPCQICDLSTTQSYADVGDLIEVKIGKFTVDRYSIKFVRIIRKFEKKPFVPTGNPMAYGTAAAIAVHEAVEFSKFNNINDIDKVLEVADDIFIWLKDKYE